MVRAPISHEVDEGRGSLSVGDGAVFAEMEPYRGPDGSVTDAAELDLLDRAGLAGVGGEGVDASRSNMPEQGWTYEFEGRNAIQSNWKIDFRG